MLDTPKKHRPRIGAILLEYDLITQEQLARALEKQIQSGSKLTSQLLGYARKGRYEIKPLNLNQLLES